MMKASVIMPKTAVQRPVEDIYARVDKTRVQIETQKAFNIFEHKTVEEDQWGTQNSGMVENMDPGFAESADGAKTHVTGSGADINTINLTGLTAILAVASAGELTGPDKLPAIKKDLGVGELADDIKTGTEALVDLIHNHTIPTDNTSATGDTIIPLVGSGGTYVEKNLGGGAYSRHLLCDNTTDTVQYK